jgi:AraC-like DNA-binding protein
MNDPSGKAPQRSCLASGEGWSVSDYRCTAGPADPPFEERHDGASVSLVTAGTFEYRTASGAAMLYPGALLLGNAAECFECGHTHSIGDRCLAVHVSQPLFEELASATVGSSRFHFSAPMLPPRAPLTAQVLALQALPLRSPLAAAEAALGLVEAALSAFRPQAPRVGRLVAQDVRRLTPVLRHVESDPSMSLDLDSLSGLACMSKFHFLRTFRRVTGTTPHQYVLGERLKRAAMALRRSQIPVLSVALEAGFEDVSTFNRHFRRVFKVSPTRFRESC